VQKYAQFKNPACLKIQKMAMVDTWCNLRRRANVELWRRACVRPRSYAYFRVLVRCGGVHDMLNFVCCRLVSGVSTNKQLH